MLLRILSIWTCRAPGTESKTLVCVFLFWLVVSCAVAQTDNPNIMIKNMVFFIMSVLMVMSAIYEMFSLGIVEGSIRAL